MASRKSIEDSGSQKYGSEADFLASEVLRQKPTKNNQSSSEKVSKFLDLPISKKTKQGLNKTEFETMTEIQAASIPYSLAGADILGAAKTGSGKTLAFCIPVIEKLYRSKWTKFDGLGALILTPSRELAMQIFEMLRTIGKYHPFSCGLVVGGNSKIEEEKKHICGMNILVATPGRLLQHMDQTYGFTCDTLEILVLDEADRLLEMGFEQQLNAIIENLPKKRQTLLFSATQTSKIKDLVRLSLNKKNMEYISVHDQEVMPKNLHQSYIECTLPNKLDVLFSFIKTHAKTKIIVFCSNQKQVAFLSAIFTLFNVTSIFKLSGNMSQNTRRQNYLDFLSKHWGTLFCTDVASRGLDFPKVDFVIHFDLPLDVKTYIHRSGRTARFVSHGKSILLILPEEKEFIETLRMKTIEIKEQKVNTNRTVSIKDQVAAMISHDVKLKFLAMKYVEMFVRTVVKNCCAVKLDINALPLKEFATRLGLSEMPNIKSALSRKIKNEEGGDVEGDESDEESEEEEIEDKKTAKGSKNSDSDSVVEEGDDLLVKPKKEKTRKKLDRLLNKKSVAANQTEGYKRLITNDAQEDDDDDLFTLKRKDHELDDDVEVPTKKKKGSHTIFRDGKAITRFEALVEDKKEQNIESVQKKHEKSIQDSVKSRDDADKALARERLKDKRRVQKEKDVEMYSLQQRLDMLNDGIDPDKLEASEDEFDVVLGSGDEDEFDVNGDGGDEQDDEHDEDIVESEPEVPVFESRNAKRPGKEISSIDQFSQTLRETKKANQEKNRNQFDSRGKYKK